MNDSAPAASRELTPMGEFRKTLTRMEPEFATALPTHIPPERFCRVTLTAIQGNPDLLNADRRSLLGAVMKCAQDGLMPDGRDAALVVFRGKAGPQVQYMPMIAGVLKKVRQSGQLATIAAHVVYEADQFEYILGDDERIMHRPAMANRGKPIAAYAIAKLADGSIQREVMTVEEVERVRAVSRAKDSGPWVQWWTEMARKTVLRRLAKYLPSTTEMEQFWQRQDEAEGSPSTIEHQPVPEAARPGPRRLREALAAVSADEQVAEVIDAETGEITAAAAETPAPPVAEATPPAEAPANPAYDPAREYEAIIEGAQAEKTAGALAEYWSLQAPVFKRLAESAPDLAAELDGKIRAMHKALKSGGAK